MDEVEAEEQVVASESIKISPSKKKLISLKAKAEADTQMLVSFDDVIDFALDMAADHIAHQGPEHKLFKGLKDEEGE